MLKSILGCLFLLFLQNPQAQEEALFRIIEQNKVGYINSKGEIKIPPVFHSGDEFHEGLAAVRQNGLYGFIDQSGQFVIKPEYDFATYFQNGLTLVYKRGLPLFIDKQGKVILPSVYRSLNFIHPNKGIVTTLTGRQGVLDLSSKTLVVDTMFSSIGDFNYGVAIVKEYIEPKRKGKERRIGVIDSSGKFIVRFGKYKTINPFYEGFAKVEIKASKNQDGDTDGVIDTRGKLLFKRPYKNNSYVDGDFHNGFATVNLYKYWIPEKNGIISTSDKDYTGFLNLNGEVVLNNEKYKYAYDFSNGRAFVRGEFSDFILLDRNFKQVGTQTFRDVLNRTFRHGYAFVKTEKGWGIIDTTGNFIVDPIYEDIDELGIIDDYFFFAKEGRYETDKVFGVVDLRNNILVKPMFQEFDRRGFINGLLCVFINDKLSYVNRKGDLVWQASEDTSGTLSYVNIDFMNRGYFYAYSAPYRGDEYESGGWATSSNKPNRFIAQNSSDENKLFVRIDTSLVDTFAKSYYGYKLFVVNATPDTIEFKAQDSRLYMKLQAMDEKGDWRDIEYLPSSWCGNSYHRIRLQPNQFWKFTIPAYEGRLRTSIRVELKYIDNDNPESEKVIYSNIIIGSVNPGQFWRKRSYYPQGIMDPYND